MKIFYISNHNPKFHNTNFYREKAIRTLGHDIVFFEDKNFRFPCRLREVMAFLQDWDLTQLNKRMVQKAKNVKPDLCMVVGGARVYKKTVEQLKEMGIKVVLWTSDAPIVFDTILDAANSYDYIFCAGTEAVEIFKAHGLKNVQWVPFACDPDYHHPVDLNNEDQKAYGYDCVFVGSHYSNRADVLNVLSEQDIGIWGPNWRLCNPELAISKVAMDKHVDFTEWVKIFCAAKINLVIHFDDGKTPCYQASPHLYEALACNSFVLADDQKDTQSLFKDGEHLVIFKDASDLKEKVFYYLEHADERSNIAKSGHQEVVKNHTYLHRFREIFKTIETL